MHAFVAESLSRVVSKSASSERKLGQRCQIRFHLPSIRLFGRWLGLRSVFVAIVVIFVGVWSGPCLESRFEVPPFCLDFQPIFHRIFSLSPNPISNLASQACLRPVVGNGNGNPNPYPSPTIRLFGRRLGLRSVFVAIAVIFVRGWWGPCLILIPSSPCTPRSRVMRTCGHACVACAYTIDKTCLIARIRRRRRRRRRRVGQCKGQLRALIVQEVGRHLRAVLVDAPHVVRDIRLPTHAFAIKLGRRHSASAAGSRTSLRPSFGHSSRRRQSSQSNLDAERCGPEHTARTPTRIARWPRHWNCASAQI